MLIFFSSRRHTVTSLPQDLVCLRLLTPAVSIPFQFFLTDLLYSIEKSETAFRKQNTDLGAPQEQVIQVYDCFVSRCPTELCPNGIGFRNTGKLIIFAASNDVFRLPTVAAVKPSSKSGVKPSWKRPLPVDLAEHRLPGIPHRHGRDRSSDTAEDIQGN